jgi:glucose/arabinose dehydrogenase
MAHSQQLAVALEEVTGGLVDPIGIENAGDGSGRLFVIQRPGQVVIVKDGTLWAEPFLDVSERVTAGGEQGLLGLAFHPDYASNGEFFIHYTEDTAGDTVIERCSVSADDPDRGDCSAEDIIFTLDQPFSNHNGGKIAFGPDEYLYIALGDGGGSGDPEENAQDIEDLHGAILRLDVDGDDFTGDPERDYAIPGDNPFVGQAGADEIWAFGLRNPWRFSFDRMTGDLWIGDVGQASWEEIDFEPAHDPGGRNYGWDVLEGEHCFEDDPEGACNEFLTGGSTLPIMEYSSDGTGHCSVTGGFRYRGTREPQLFGVYLFADFCSGTIWGTLPNCTGAWEMRVLAEPGLRITTFGEDEAGEVYVAEFSDDKLHRLTVDDNANGPALTPDPAALDYGTGFKVGDTATLATEFTHSGTGDDAVIIDAFGLSDPDHFSLDPSGGADPCGPAPVCLPPGGSCTVAATFAPRREGGFDEFLTVLANSPPAPVSLLGEVSCTGPDHLTLDDRTVDSDAFFTGCLTITTGPSFTVDLPARVELRAGERITLGPGTAVAAGAALTVAIDPVLTQ